MDLNKVMLIGNVVRDPELRTTPAGQSVASLSVATNLVWKDKSGTRQSKAEFHNIVAWRQLADIVGRYIKKGSKVYVEGRLETRSWDDQNGIKRSRTEIIADNVIMLDRAGFGQAADGGTARTPANNVSADTQEALVPPASASEEEISVEDIPF